MFTCIYSYVNLVILMNLAKYIDVGFSNIMCSEKQIYYMNKTTVSKDTILANMGLTINLL